MVLFDQGVPLSWHDWHHLTFKALSFETKILSQSHQMISTAFAFGVRIYDHYEAAVKEWYAFSYSDSEVCC